MTRITSASIGSQSPLYRRVPFRVLLLGAIVLVATVGTGVGLVAADSTAVQQQPAPTNNSSNESLTDTVIPNSSNVSTVNATNNTTADENESETTPAVTSQSAVNGAANPSANTTVDEPTSNSSEANATSTTTIAGNQSATTGEGESERESENTAGVQFTFPNQTTNGTSVTVREPRLPEGGFLVVHGRSYPENGLGSVIGVSEYIAPNSSYERVQIRLFDVAGRSFERSQLRAPSTMYVQAVLDTNGNQQYDALATTGAQDVSYLIDGSRPAVAGARITVNQPVETASQPGELGDGFVPDQNQTTAPSASTTSNESETATSGGGFVLNPNQGSGFELGSVPTSLGNFGPLLVLLGGLVVGIYIKQQ
jgi:hypothetical protein